MRGVADQRQPLADERARHEIAQRKRARLVERLDLTEMQAEALLEFGMKFIFIQGDDAGGFGSLLGPYQRGAFAGQWQDRERSGGQEVLLGAALVIALMADCNDDAGLIVVPAVGDDAGSLAQSRTRAVGRHQQARLDRGAVRQRHIDAIGPRGEIGHGAGAQIDALGLGSRGQRIDQLAVFDHVRKGFARLDMAGEGQEYRSGGVFQFGIGDDHVEDRLRAGGDLVPDAYGIQ